MNYDTTPDDLIGVMQKLEHLRIRYNDELSRCKELCIYILEFFHLRRLDVGKPKQGKG